MPARRHATAGPHSSCAGDAAGWQRRLVALRWSYGAAPGRRRSRDRVAIWSCASLPRTRPRGYRRIAGELHRLGVLSHPRACRGSSKSRASIRRRGRSLDVHAPVPLRHLQAAGNDPSSLKRRDVLDGQSTSTSPRPHRVLGTHTASGGGAGPPEPHAEISDDPQPDHQAVARTRPRTRNRTRPEASSTAS